MFNFFGVCLELWNSWLLNRIDQVIGFIPARIWKDLMNNTTFLNHFMWLSDNNGSYGSRRHFMRCSGCASNIRNLHHSLHNVCVYAKPWDIVLKCTVLGICCTTRKKEWCWTYTTATKWMCTSVLLHNITMKETPS